MAEICVSLIHLVKHPSVAVQDSAGRCLATLCRIIVAEGMEAVVGSLLPLLGDTKSAHNRYGAALALHCILRANKYTHSWTWSVLVKWQAGTQFLSIVEISWFVQA